ncbi:MAG: polyprenyl synthetase family protein [Pseudomonadota bacterium]
MATADSTAGVPTLAESASVLGAQINAFLAARLPQENVDPKQLHQAMRYAVFNGGKRMRPLLAYGAADALGMPRASVDPLAAAVELIHAYSLIHDDLPAMDDDDLRRGQPAVHRQYDEATAILAGDALQALAFEVLVEDQSERAAPLAVALARACGSQGMAGGQMVDLQAVGEELNANALASMHRLKTGALIRCSVTLPALACRAPQHLLAALDRYGDRVGLAFQIQDDVLDVAGATQDIGKPQGSDAEQGKPTFPACLGLEASRDKAQELVDEARAGLKTLPGDTTLLEQLARFSIIRGS